MSSNNANPFRFDLNNFTGVFDPAPIYDAVGSAAGVWAGVLPFMLFIVFSFRYFSESARNLTGNARMAEAGGELLNKSVTSFAYAFGGFMILKFLIALAGYFYSYGSFSVIANDFGQLIADLKARQRNYDADFITNFLDILTISTAPISYVYFLLASSLFVFCHALMRFAYAIFFGVTYLWGFIAIPSGALKTMSLEQGWIRSFLILGIWPIMEATLYLFTKAIIAKLAADTLSGYGGANIAQFSALHGLMGSLCLVLLIITLAAPYMAIRIGSNQEALTGLLTPAIVAAAYVRQQVGSQAGKIGGSMLPEAGGERHRDGLFEKISTINKTGPGSIGSAASSAISSSARGLGNAVSNAMKNKS